MPRRQRGLRLDGSETLYLRRRPDPLLPDLEDTAMTGNLVSLIFQTDMMRCEALLIRWGA
ncbi:hypothetical protein WG908_08280 [Sphingobium sp. AN641]|uniref:hypothetical protein n=1 Tax=Sphingobium sp. AN641 TaxID=3133443 RepID=UPI0030C4BEF7